MTEIKTHLRQDTTIDTTATLYGIITGNVTVTNSVDFIVLGTINGEITIQQGSSVTIYGKTKGNIFNEGQCKIYGAVTGKLSGNKFDIEPNAVIKL
ncbi:polymer-forming cytoskeletal protein [Aurantibacillus circumpalustris]|uniref:polymer-forming cytoskeletal protein n=1 Tax=Aurantibacillus circumpalustris TaxID=3036359 RepID=UPI00295BF68F|nr:polymer-forming cytoskeletal protein [Aurantibacillus circumpalustris]